MQSGSVLGPVSGSIDTLPLFPCDVAWPAIERLLALTAEESRPVRLLAGRMAAEDIAADLGISHEALAAILDGVCARLGVAGFERLAVLVCGMHDFWREQLPCPLRQRELSDEETMSAVATGHRGAFDQLFNRSQAWMERIAHRWLRVAHLAPDVAQEVLYELSKARRDRVPIREFRAFVCTLIRRRCRYYWRIDRRKLPRAQSLTGSEVEDEDLALIGTLQQRLRGGLSPNDPNSLPSREPSPESRAEERERASALHQALSRLPERLRHTLELRYFDGLRVSEIAERGPMTFRAAQSRLDRGIEHLRILLAKSNAREWPV